MAFQKLYAPSLKEMFIQQLSDMIISGELTPGTRLPSERELCEQMRVSRAVVNSGISELSRQGFLEVRPRQGVYVADYWRSGNLDTLIAILHHNPAAFNKEDLQSFFELCRGIHHLALQLMIARASDEELQRLSDLAGQLAAELTPAQAAEIAFTFRHEMMLASGNKILPLLYISLRQPLMTLNTRFCRKYGVPLLHQTISRFCELLLKRDEAALSKMIDECLNAITAGDYQLHEA